MQISTSSFYMLFPRPQNAIAPFVDIEMSKEEDGAKDESIPAAVEIDDEKAVSALLNQLRLG